MTKWYVDCVSDAGDVCIAYWLRLGWRSVALTFVSSLLFVDGKLTTRSGLSRAIAPHVDGDVLSWATNGIDVQMQRRASAVSASLLGDVVRWRCELPAADGHIRVGGTTVRGRGYAEVLTLAAAPWKLPIEELRWGRFIGERSSAVWIDWRGAHPLTFVASSGRRADAATVDDSRISFDGRDLTLDDPKIIRDAPLRETLEEVPLLSRMMPRRLNAMQECKWRSRGTLRGEGSSDHGWSIHEVVRFA
ncbi:MAG TPA: hypothetical protein VFV49_03065 [Thermoanaerobaculia bacterium]|nr:hypothetical protein [Thermoanaerobaculia bacterium]